MIQTIKFEQLPDEMQYRLLRSKYYLKINYYPLRQLYFETGIAINTLRKIRYTHAASRKTWEKLLIEEQLKLSDM